MLPGRVSNPRPLTYESGALPIALRGPATVFHKLLFTVTVKLTGRDNEKRDFFGIFDKGP